MQSWNFHDNETSRTVFLKSSDGMILSIKNCNIIYSGAHMHMQAIDGNFARNRVNNNKGNSKANCFRSVKEMLPWQFRKKNDFKMC